MPLTLEDILLRSTELSLETDENSITPARVGELIYGLANLFGLNISTPLIGASKLSELTDVLLLNDKEKDILQKIGTKWTNVPLDIDKLSEFANWFKLDALGNIYTEKNFYSKLSVSAYGAGTGGGGTGVTALSALTDVQLTTPATDDILKYNSVSGKWENTPIPTASSVYWDDVLNKPTTFTPATHVHAIADVTGLQTALNGKQPFDFDLDAIANLSGTSGYLRKTAANTWELRNENYSLSNHTHTPSEVGLGNVLNVASYSKTESDNLLLLKVDKVTGKSLILDTEIARLAGVTNQTLSGLGGEPAFSKNTGFNKNFGTGAGTVAEGNHSHTFASLTSKPTTLAGYGITNAYTKTEADGLFQLKTAANDLFVKENIGTISSPIWVIKANYDLYSVGGISAYGIGSSGSTGVSYDRLDTWSYDSSKSEWVLSAFLGNDLNTRLSTHTHTFASLTSKPTTLAGYGITDSYNKTESDTALGLKVNKVSGKSLIADTEITRLAGVTNQTLSGLGGEPAFSKNTAFNKNFGTTAGTVSEGNHTHTFASLTSKPTTLAGYGITNASINTHTHTFASLTSKPTTLAGYGITDALLSSAYTAADVLTKIKTVDGDGSGLDADTLDGKHFAKSGNWDKIAYIGLDGVMEVGKYLDFHETATGTTDYDGRLSSLSGVGKWNDNILYHAGNSNRTDVNWSAATLTANTDILLNSITATDKSVKNFINAFNNAFDLSGGIIKAKQNLYGVGEITAYNVGAGVAGLILTADMNANAKNISNVNTLTANTQIRLASGAFLANDPFGYGYDYTGLYADSNGDHTLIEYNADYDSFNLCDNMVTIANNTVTASQFKFGNYSFKQDGSGRLGIYNGTTEIACFNTDGTYINL